MKVNEKMVHKRICDRIELSDGGGGGMAATNGERMKEDRRSLTNRRSRISLRSNRDKRYHPLLLIDRGATVAREFTSSEANWNRSVHVELDGAQLTIS